MREKILERCLDPNDAIRLRAVEIVTEAALASEAARAEWTLGMEWGETCTVLDKQGVKSMVFHFHVD